MDKNKNKPEKSVDILKWLKDEGIRVKKVFNVTAQNIIITTEEKMRSQLNTYLIHVEKKRRWMVPFGMLISIVIPITTSNFKSALGLSAETWETIYLLGLIIDFIWLIWCLKDAFKDTSTDGFINNIKKMS